MLRVSKPKYLVNPLQLITVNQDEYKSPEKVFQHFNRHSTYTLQTSPLVKCLPIIQAMIKITYYLVRYSGHGLNYRLVKYCYSDVSVI